MTPNDLLTQYGPRESMSYDVVIVGAGVAGLASAIRLKQLALASGNDISVVVLEKGAEVGSHVLSGCVLDVAVLDELLPDWQQTNAPIKQQVTADQVLILLNEKRSIKTPDWLVPPCLHNDGAYVVSLGKVSSWLAQQAEQLGVEIFPGFSAAQLLYAADGAIAGVITGDLGLDKSGKPTANFQLGMELRAKYCIFAEGSRGHLGKELIEQFQLDKDSDPQCYAIGLKEIWQIEPQQHQAGLVVHASGWPLDNSTYGGAFMYHAADNKVYFGMVIGLDYKNTYLDPFQELQRLKLHPSFSKYFQGNAKRLGYGARSITAGGLSCLPKLYFPGGLLVGCEAGLLNSSRIKGAHTAIKSGMLAAESIAAALTAGRQGDELVDYWQALSASWLHAELKKSRNFKQWFQYGRMVGNLMTGVEQWLLRGRFPWTIHRKYSDYSRLKPAKQCQPINYPAADGKLTFDLMSSLYLSNTHHNENQPVHLQLKDVKQALQTNIMIYAKPDSRFCPAGVYEYSTDAEGKEQLQINASNCLHCKTCDIKDPQQNINWTTPEGGDGPNYVDM